MHQISRLGLVKKSQKLTDASDQAKKNNLGDGDDPQALAEIIRILHLSNEAGQGNLADEGIADVKEGRQAINEGCAGGRYHQNRWLATNFVTKVWTVGGIQRVTRRAMFAFGSGKCRGKDDADECEEGRNSGEL